MSKSISNTGSYDSGIAFSSVVTILCMFADVPDAIDMRVYMNSMKAYFEKHDTNDSELRTYRRHLRQFHIFITLYVFVAAYGLIKLVMGTQVCEHGMWNIN